MNVALAAGCAIAGLAVGGFLDSMSGRIERAPEPVLADQEIIREPVAVASVPITDGPVHSAPPATVPKSRAPAAREIALSAAITGVAFFLLAVRLGAVPALAGYCALFAGLIAASVVDARLGIVPRTVLYPTFAAMTVGLVAASAVEHRWRALDDAAIGGAVAFAVFFALWWFFPRGMGYGDVRLAGVIGAGLGWLGFAEIYVGFLAAFVVGTVVGVVVMARQGTGRKTRFAFGPALSVGAAFGVLWGPWAVHLWLHHG